MRELFITSNTIINLSKNEKIEPKIINRAELGIDSFQANYQILGETLLTHCLQQTELFAQAISLKNYAPLVYYEILEQAIENDKPEVLAFLLEHGKIAINSYRLQEGSNRGLALLSSAFQSQSLSCFILLLQHNASSAVLLGDLPLAHVLLQLPVDNPFYSAFFQHCKPVRDDNPTFYSRLARRIASKLNDPQLSSEEKGIMQRAKDDYRGKSSFSSTIKLPESVHKDVAEIRSYQNQEALQELRNSPEYKEKEKELAKISRELEAVIKKQRLTEQVKRECKQYYDETVKFMRENDVRQNLTKGQYLAYLDKQIEMVKARITLARLGSKISRLRTAEVKEYNKAVLVVQKFIERENSARKLYSDANSIINEALNLMENHSVDLSDIFDSTGGILASLKQMSAPMAKKIDKLNTLINKNKSLNSESKEELSEEINLLSLDSEEKNEEGHLSELPNQDNWALIAYPKTLFNQNSVVNTRSLDNEKLNSDEQSLLANAT